MEQYKTEFQDMVSDNNLMNSYKLFLLKTIINNSSFEKNEFEFYELACWMCAFSFPVVCKLGKRIRHFDRLYDNALLIIDEEGILMSSNTYNVFKAAYNSNSSRLRRSVSSLMDYVPYRLLAYKWYEELLGKNDKQKNNTITELSIADKDSFYRIIIDENDKKRIVIGVDWLMYIKKNRTELLQWIDERIVSFVNKG